jgi:hypothetical protein
MSITLAEVILGNKNEYNGHKQLELEGLSFNIHQILQLCQDLQDELHKTEGFLSCVVYKVHPDYGGSIYALDYFKEHPSGHKDKLLVDINLEKPNA